MLPAWEERVKTLQNYIAAKICFSESTVVRSNESHVIIKRILMFVRYLCVVIACGQGVELISGIVAVEKVLLCFPEWFDHKIVFITELKRKTCYKLSGFYNRIIFISIGEAFVMSFDFADCVN